METEKKIIGLLDSCFAEIDERADSLRAAMNEAQQGANEYGPPKDRYDSFRTQLLRKRDMFAQQLQKVMVQRAMLDKVASARRPDRVSFGALVITDTQRIFVSVGLGRIIFEGEEYFVISPAVPIYQSMDGLGVGDTFSFRGQSSTIREIL